MNNIRVNLLCIFLVIILLGISNCREDSSRQDREPSVTPSPQTITGDSKPRNEKISDGVPTEISSPEESPILYFADLVEHGQVTIAKDFQNYMRDNPSLLQPIKLFHGRRKSIRHHPLGGGLTNTITFENIQLAQHARLIFSIGMFSEGKADFASDGAKFEILLRPDHGEPYLLFEETLTTFEAWQDYVVDLSAYAGKSITLEWTTEALEHNHYDWATWGTPRLTHLSSENTGQPDTKELNSAKKYESIIDSYRNIPFTPGGSRVDRGWFANATATDILLSDVRVNTIVRTEIFVIERAGQQDEEVTIELFDEKDNVLSSSVYKITAQDQVISDEYNVHDNEKLPKKIRISLDDENPPIVFIKVPIQYALRDPEHENTKPNVLLISLDTLRADHVGCYGYERNVSPNIDALAAESFIFTNAYSNSNWTLPAHISMFTSLYPSQHQIVLTTRQNPTFDFYSSQWPYYYLPQAFKDSHYVTLAFTGGGFVDSKYGFNKGFDYHVENIEELNNTSLDILIHFIETHKEIPMFVFFHTYEIHDYFKEKPIHRKYIQNNFQIDNDMQLLDLLLLFRESAFSSFLGTSRITRIQNTLLHDEGTQYVRDLYDGAIAYTDNLVGELFDELKKMGLYDNTWIVLTSDHGEGLGEIHNDSQTFSWHHGGQLYDDQIKIPLIIKPPKDIMQKYSKQHMIELLVETIDIPPTLLSILEADSHEQFRGKTLFPLFTVPETLSEGKLFSEHLQRGQFSIIDGQYKLIMRPDCSIYNHTLRYTYQLYDRNEDNAENVNLLKHENYAKYVPIYNDLKQTLVEHVKDLLSTTCPDVPSSTPATPTSGDEEVDEKHLQRLKDLGYL